LFKSSAGFVASSQLFGVTVATVVVSFNTVVSNAAANVASSVAKFNIYSIIQSVLKAVSHTYADFIISITAAFSASVESFVRLFKAHVNTNHVKAHVFDNTFHCHSGMFFHRCITIDLILFVSNTVTVEGSTSVFIILGNGTI